MANDRDTASERPHQKREPDNAPSAATQFKQAVAAMPYAQQVAALQPDLPVQFNYDSAVQADGELGCDAASIHQIASSGLSGSGGTLPHVQQIQEAFGSHDVSGVSAHVGGQAEQANSALGAKAYASGEQIAFKSSPDLHTAAHEAAHVVQQRSGVQLSGGVGRVGDQYEQHADKVADRVVSGSSASDLLDAISSGSGGGGVQAKEEPVQFVFDDTKLEGTTVYADIAAAARAKLEQNRAGAPSTSDTTAADQAATTAKDPSQLKTVQDFLTAIGDDSTKREQWTENNKRKVDFEVELAKALIDDTSEYKTVVEDVSKRIYEYFREKKKALGEIGQRTTITAEVTKMVGMYGFKAPEKPLHGVFYGRIKDGDLTDDSIPKIVTRVMRIMRDGGGSISNHIYAQHQFMDHIYNSDFYEKGQWEEGVAKHVLAQVDASFKAQEPKILRTMAEGNAFGMLRDEDGELIRVEGELKDDGSTRGRTNKSDLAGASGSAARGTANSQVTGIASGDTGPVRAGATADPDVQAHGRGVDIYELDPTQRFIQEALVLHDMPLAAGISGTTTDLLECALTFGIAAGTKECFQYLLGCLNQLMGAGAHSFHEIMSAAKTAGIDYEDGNYRCLLQFGLNSAIAPLFTQDKYKEIPGIGFDP